MWHLDLQLEHCSSSSSYLLSTKNSSEVLMQVKK